MIALYPIGIPFFVSWIFFKNRDRLMDASTQNNSRQQQQEANTVANENDARTWASFGSEWESFGELNSNDIPWYYGDRTTFHFLIRDYSPKYFYFEVVDFTRKLLLTGILMIVDRGTIGQILLGIIITFAFATATAVIQPYADRRANQMRILADVSLFFTLQCILLLHADVLGDCERFTANDVGLLLIFINFVLLMLAGVQELLRRCFHIYNEAQLVGISYAPEKQLGNTSKVTKVYHGKYKATVSTTAIPCVVKIRPPEKRVLEMETMIMLQVFHPNIVRMFRAEEDRSQYYLASEVCDYSITEAFEAFDIAIGPMSARLQLCRGNYGCSAAS